MSISFICVHGHRWDEQNSATLPATCPLCGGAVEPCTAGVSEGTATEGLLQATPTATVPGPEVEQAEALPELPGYEVRRLLGKGGMGIVVLARHQRLGRLVAIKLPLHGLSDEGRSRFLREARAAAGLRHPNICPVHDVGEHQGRPYLVMDYIDGPTLREWMGQNPAARRCAEVVALLARAVAHAHDKGVIHRDLKPSNVLIERSTGQPVLTDFGLAKLLDEAGDQLSQSGLLQGTPAYMSPEQAAGRPGQVGRLSDVYSLGAILYELLTGRPPYAGSVGEILRRVQTDDPPPPRRGNPSIHPDLETICLAAMARDPGQRYPSPLALAEDLERFARGETIRARRASLVQRSLRWLRLHPVPVVSAAAGLVAVLAVALLVLAFLAQARQRQQLDDLRAAFDEGLEHPEATEAYFESMEGYLASLERLSSKQVPELRERMIGRVAASIRASLEQPRLTPEAEERVRAALASLRARAPEAADSLAQLLNERQSGWRVLFDLQPPFGDWHKVLAARLKVLPDRLERDPQEGRGLGALLRSGAECRGLVRLDAVFDPSWSKAARVGLILNYVEGPTGEVQRVAVAPDGQALAAACGPGGPSTCLCDPATGRVRHTLPAEGRSCAAAFAPGGLLASAGPRGSIRLCDASSGQETASVFAHAGAVLGLAFSPDGHTLASCGEDGSVRLWDVGADGRSLHQRTMLPRCHAGRPVNDVAFALDCETLASAGDDGVVRLWGVKSGQLVRTLTGHAGRVRRVTFGPAGEGPLLASAGEDGTVRLWRADLGKELAALRGEAGSAYDAAFSPDGKALAVAYAGRCVKVWDTATQRVRLEITTFTDQVLAVAFTPDGGSVLTGDAARTLRRWDALSGREVWSLESSAGYAFVLSLPETHGPEGAGKPAALGDALAGGLPLRMQIFRNGRLQRESSVRLPPEGPLHLRASREGERLVFQANDQTALEFQDVFPLGIVRPGVFALDWPAGVGLRGLRAERRGPPASPSLLEQGDESYARGDFAAAADRYSRQAQKDTQGEGGREARYKWALCLLASSQQEEALPLLRQLGRGVTEDRGDRWGLLADCQLWLYHLRRREIDQADEVFRLLETHYRFEQLAALISDELRGQILNAYRSGNTSTLAIRKNPRDARHLRRVLDVEALFAAPWPERVWTAHSLCARHLFNGEADQAVRTAEELLRDPALPVQLTCTLVTDLVWALRQKGEPVRALAELDQRLTGPSGRFPLALLPLLLERAALLASQKKWAAAERDIAVFLRNLDPARWRYGSWLRARALLIRGFLRQEQGDTAGAQQAWREGLGLIKGTPFYATNEGFLLASLEGNVTEADVLFLIEQTTHGLGIPAAGFIRKSKEFDTRWLASVLRNLWRSRHGRDYGRRVAFQDLSYLDAYGIQFALFIAEAFRQGALASDPSPEQEALIWNLAEGVYRAYTKNEFSDAQVFLGLNTWLGSSGFTGWGGLSATLQVRPDLRGPLAYLFAQRFLRLKKTDEARTLLEAALKDARPDTPLRRLARQALEPSPRN